MIMPIFILILRFLSILHLVQGADQLLPRDDIIHVCNADNCLRQLRGNGKSFPFCTTYLGNPYPRIIPPTSTFTATVRETVFSVGGGGGYVTRADTPYIPPNKRDLNDILAPVPTVTLEPRQASPLPTFASSCGSAPTQLSSACTCLIGYTGETPTTTVTRTLHGVYTTESVCDPRNNYDLRPNYQGYWEYNTHPRFSSAAHPEITTAGPCCTLCYHTPGCAAFYLDFDTGFCVFSLLVGSGRETPNDRVCPHGIVEVYDPYVGYFNGDYGLGVCAWLQYSDE